MSEYKELKRKIQEKNKTIIAVGEEIVVLVRDAIFAIEDAQFIDCVRIQGYTPSYNDGENCEFSTTLDYPEVELNDAGLAKSGNEQVKIQQTVGKITALITPQLLAFLYVNNFELQLRKDSIKTEEYDCGY